MSRRYEFGSVADRFADSGEADAATGIIRGYLERLAHKMDTECGVGAWEAGDIADILVEDMRAYGVKPSIDGE